MAGIAYPGNNQACKYFSPGLVSAPTYFITIFTLA